MYDFVGWFGNLSYKHSPSDLLDSMLPSYSLSHIGPQSVMASNSGIVGETGAVTYLISGRPRWHSPRLANEATKEGNGPVFARVYQDHGPNVLQQLNGDFSIAAYNQDTGEGILAIDRMGIHPLCYAEVPGGLVFGGDIRRLRRHPSISADFNPLALFAYLYFHMIPSPLATYREMKKLLPGQYVIWRPTGIEQGFHWRPDFRDDPRPEPELAQELKHRLQQAVAEDLGQSQQTGAFLSGGLDSSTITGLFKQLASEEAAAFSIGFDAEGYDEMGYARSSARHFGVRLHEYYVTPDDVVSAIPSIAAEYDEPFGNASAIPTYYCARLARENGKNLILAGDGGDELFAGNERYRKQRIFSLYNKIPEWLQNLLIEPLVQFELPLPLSDKLKSYVEQAKLPMPDRMETYNFLHRSSLSEIFEADFLASIDSNWPLTHLREFYQEPDTDSMLKRMLYLDWKITLADNDLRKVNRMCRLAGIEVRYPMLQGPVVELAATIPDHMLMCGFELRSFYRRAFSDFLPKSTLEKRKHGFGLPFGLWLQSDPALQSLAYDSLNSRYFSGIIKSSYLDDLKSRHQGEHASYYGVMIWVLMMWAQWAEQHH